MAFPILNVAVDFEGDGTFVDISAYLMGLRIRRGSSRVEGPLIRYEAGTCELTLNNSDRRFDSTHLTGPYTLPSGSAASGIQQALSNRVQTYGHGFTVAVASADPETVEASLRDSTVTTSGSTSFAAAKPTLAVGDIVVALQTGDWGAASAMSTPTGGATWQLLDSLDAGTNALHSKIWWKALAASDVAATWTFFQASGSDGVVIIGTVRDAAGTPAFASAESPGTVAVDTPSVSPSGTADYELRMVAGSGGAGSVWDWSTTDDYTEAEDSQSGNFTTASMAHKSLSGLVSASGGTLVKPMRPVRVRAIWDATGTNTNLIGNTSFETNTTGWDVAGGNTTLARSSTVGGAPDAGSWAMSITRTGANPPFNLYNARCTSLTGASGTGGRLFYLSAYVYIPAASFAKVTGIVVGGDAFSNVFVPNTQWPTADTWHRVGALVRSNSDPGNVQFQFWTDNTHSNGQIVAYIDDAHAEVAEHDLFRGYADNWQLDSDIPNKSVATVPCTDAFKLFSRFDRRAADSVAAPSELSSARINRILDNAGWPSSLRSIATGDVTLQASTLNSNLMEELLLTNETEVGELYVTGDGKVFFRNRNAINNDSRSTTSQAIFGDGGGTELPYTGLPQSDDDTQLVNRVIITRVGGSEQVAEDVASQDEFLVSTYERSDLLFNNDAAALNMAQWVLSLSAQPERRFESIEIKPQRDDDALFPQAFTRLVGDRITIRRRPPGGGLIIEQDYFVRGIEHEATPGAAWITRWTLQSTAAGGSFFVIGHATRGRLDLNPLGF